MRKRLLRTLISALTIATLACGTVFAKDPDTVFLRARILYECPGKDDMPLPDDSFELADHWKKDGDYWYYTEPVKDGQSIDFLKSVQIPHDWNSNSAGQTFNLVIYADAAENVNGSAAWDGLINGHDGKKSRAIKLDLTLNEYELDENGNRIPYENNKTVLPGDQIDKQVVLTVDFTYRTPSGGGSSDDDDDDWEPNPPEKVVYPIVPVKPSDPDPVTPDWSPLADTGDHSNTAIYFTAAIIALLSAALFAQKVKSK